MSRISLRIVLILLVLILLIVSTLFGVLTYWLDAQVLVPFAPGQGYMAPAECCLSWLQSVFARGPGVL